MDSSRIEKNVVFLNLCTVGKIYTPISSFLRKRVVNIVILELGPVSNEGPNLVILYLIGVFTNFQIPLYLKK